MASMNDVYKIEGTSEIITPALLVFEDVLRENLKKMIQIAGNPAKLRPHCKTHKIREVAEMEIACGIVKHKCATFAEAEMLARAGAKDIFLAYNLVGPNVGRAVKFQQQFPDLNFSVTADHAKPIAELGHAMTAAGLEMDVLLDVDSGMGRTGVAPGQQAVKLYQSISETAGLRAGGLHLYDGQNHQTDLHARRAAVDVVWNQGVALRDACVVAGLRVPRIVAGGTCSFPVFATKDDPALELSPGTTVFHDMGYVRMYPDLDFVPAAVLLSRVISCPGKNRVTLDLGTKACASDPPAGDRLYFPDLPTAREVLQNEEHLVLETSAASRFQPGDELLAIPRHICPTVALHKQVIVVRERRIIATWEVVARDRFLTV